RFENGVDLRETRPSCKRPRRARASRRARVWTDERGMELAAGEPMSSAAVATSAPLGESDIYYFREGTHARLYRVLGAHPAVVAGPAGLRFAACAPNEVGRACG